HTQQNERKPRRRTKQTINKKQKIIQTIHAVLQLLVLFRNSSSVILHWRTRAVQVAVTKDIVNPVDRWPVFVIPEPGRREGSLVLAVGAIPGLIHDVGKG